jgi:hypothetical protein
MHDLEMHLWSAFDQAFVGSYEARPVQSKSPRTTLYIPLGIHSIPVLMLPPWLWAGGNPTRTMKTRQAIDEWWIGCLAFTVGFDCFDLMYIERKRKKLLLLKAQTYAIAWLFLLRKRGVGSKLSLRQQYMQTIRCRTTEGKKTKPKSALDKVQ